MEVDGAGSSQEQTKIKGGLKKLGDVDLDGPQKHGAGWVPFTDRQIEGLREVAQGAWELAKLTGMDAMAHAKNAMKQHWSPQVERWFQNEFELYRNPKAPPVQKQGEPTTQRATREAVDGWTVTSEDKSHSPLDAATATEIHGPTSAGGSTSCSSHEHAKQEPPMAQSPGLFGKYPLVTNGYVKVLMLALIGISAFPPHGYLGTYGNIKFSHFGFIGTESNTVIDYRLLMLEYFIAIILFTFALSTFPGVWKGILRPFWKWTSHTKPGKTFALVLVGGLCLSILISSWLMFNSLVKRTEIERQTRENESLINPVPIASKSLSPFSHDEITVNCRLMFWGNDVTAELSFEVAGEFLTLDEFRGILGHPSIEFQNSDSSYVTSLSVDPDFIKVTNENNVFKYRGNLGWLKSGIDKIDLFTVRF